MNKKMNQQEERGQSLVLVALAMVGLLAFAGLALDGGLAYVTRRVAQNAADSASIAGIYELHRQKSAPGFNASQLDQPRILSEIHKVVESHDVPDTDGIPGNEINDNVRAFYVSQGSGGNSCSNAVDTDYQELCALDPDDPCDATEVRDNAVGISIEVDVPFEPIFAGFMGWDQIKVSNRANNFDQRTAAIVNAEDRGYNSDLWAIFAMSHGETSGLQTFIEVDPVFQPPVGSASANVHSQGSFTVGDHPFIPGQVTYCTTGGCSNCFNAYEVPEQTQKKLELPDFTYFADLAEERAEAAGTVFPSDTIWGASIDDPINQNSGHFILYEILVIDGDFNIPEDRLAIGNNLFIYVKGNVQIDGFFSAVELTIIADGEIEINGTLKNVTPFPRNANAPEFNTNVAVLWSSSEGEYPINITGDNSVFNSSIELFFSNNDTIVSGAIISQDSNVTISSNTINTTVRGSVIGNVVLVNSNADTGFQTRIQYNGNYFPKQPDRIELLK